MKSHHARRLALALAATAGGVLLGTSAASAGQLKTLNTQVLGVNGQVTAYSSPKNTNSAMEMEVYEWQTAAVQVNWRCRILSNQTTRALSLRMIGLTGVELASCTTAPGGTCDTPSVTLGATFKFMCTVATGAGSPIPSDTSWYRIAVQRTS